MKKKISHRLIRVFVQLIFLSLFIYFFIQTRYGAKIGFQNLFFHIDPLILLVASIAGRTIILSTLPALVIVVLTLIFGRFFCGFICPLGTIIDISDWFKNKFCDRKCNIENEKAHRSYKFRPVKYFLFLFLLICALIGTLFIQFLDPLIILERTLTLSLYAIAT